MSAIDSSSMTALRGNVSPRAQAKFDQGAVEEPFPMPHMSLVFKLSASQQSQLSTLLLALQSPSSPNYHRWLTPAQYASRFGLAPADLAKVVAWLENQGFTVEETAHGGNWVSFSGTAGQVEATFQTAIHRYAISGETHYANATEPSVPSALANVVLGIRGLDNFRPAPRVIRRSFRPGAKFTSQLSGDHFLAPADFATIYDVQSLYNSGITGAGVTIAVMGQTDISLNDIAEFRSNSGLVANNPTVVTTPVYVSITSSGDLTEADLDLEWSGAVAPNASIIYENSGNSANGAFDSLTYAIDDDVAPVLSISYGNCEEAFGAALVETYQAQLQQANAQGMTVVAPGGDDGATDCDESAGITAAVNGLAVDFPGSSPNATSVGGTEFYNDSATGANTYWSASNNAATMGSALSYIPEMVWNDSATSISAGQGLSASGGGASIFFTKPAWQTGEGVPNDDARDTPDMALAASADHDGYLICSSDYVNFDTTATADCSSGFYATDNTLYVVGGSSAATPAFAGIVALINQKTGSRQGNINEVLYPLAAAAPDAFHDITSGSNDSPCSAGSIDCPSGGEIGFEAGPGYDQATGLGSIDAFNLVSKWTSVAPITGATPDFAVSAFSNGLTITPGTSGSSTITVFPNNNFTGTVSLSCSVPSSLAGVTCSLSPTTVSGGGTAIMTVSAAFSARVFGGERFGGFRWPPGLLLVAFGSIAILVGLRFRQRPWAIRAANFMPGRVWLALALAGLLAAAVSCGGGSSSSTSTTTPPTSESGTVTVTGVSGTLSHTTQVTVIID